MPNVEKTVQWAERSRVGGFTQIENALLDDESLSGPAKLAYILFASYAWRDEKCWPGQLKIAARMGVTPKTLRGYIAELAAAGLVESTRRGANQTNVYILHVHGTVNITDPPMGKIYPTGSVEITHEEYEGEEDEEDGSSTRPFDDVLELRNSERTVEADTKVSVARNERAKTLGEVYSLGLCLKLADRIEANGCRKPTITKTWEKEARLLVDKDGVSPDEVKAAIDWATSHHFWKTNILSMPTLRRQFDRLRMQAQAEREGGSVKQREHNAAQESIRRLIEEEDAKERGVLA